MRALEGRERVLGKEHPETLDSINRLAKIYATPVKLRPDANALIVRFDQAEALYKRALAAEERVFGKDHPQTLATADGLAWVLSLNSRRSDEAEPLYKHSLEVRERLLGKDHLATLASLTNLALHYQRQRRFDEAEMLFKRGLEARDRLLGKEHPDTLLILQNLAALYTKQGRAGIAEPLLQRIEEAKRHASGSSCACMVRQSIYRPAVADGTRRPRKPPGLSAPATRFEYSLTGRALPPVLQEICRWANRFTPSTWTPPEHFMTRRPALQFPCHRRRRGIAC